jgi:hypothetical protein
MKNGTKIERFCDGRCLISPKREATGLNSECLYSIEAKTKMKKWFPIIGGSMLLFLVTLPSPILSFLYMVGLVVAGILNRSLAAKVTAYLFALVIFASVWFVSIPASLPRGE